MLLSELLPAGARAWPSSPAAVCCGREWTYAEMCDRVGRLAAGYVALGVQPGDRVALIARHCHRATEAVLAAVTIGALPFAINPSLTTGEILEVLNDGDPSLLLYSREYARTAATLPTRMRVSLDEGGDDISVDALLAPLAPLNPVEAGTTDPAVIIYTGGTTGTPRGVVHSHGSLLASSWCEGSIASSLGTHERALALGGPVHISGHLAVYRVLGRGWTLVYQPVGATPADLIDLCDAERVTRIGLIASRLRDMSEYLTASGRTCDGISCVSHAGAPTSAATFRAAMAAFPRATVIDIYGSTEGGIMSAIDMSRLVRRGAPAERLGSVGRPDATYAIRVVDEAGQHLPSGQVGEIVCRGERTMIGYWRNHDATAAVLQDGWLRTGDLGRVDEDGYLYLLDRKKDFIITSNENVYSVEVERALATHGAVRDCAVVGAPTGDEGEEVVAIVALADGADLSLAELQAHCGQTLAPYKVPARLEIVPTLPRTITGKVDKGRLRASHWRDRARSIN